MKGRNDDPAPDSTEGQFLDPNNIDALAHGEFLSIERLEEYAAALARSHRIVSRPRRRDAPVLARLRDNERALTAAYRELAAAARGDRILTPAADWFVDNFFIVTDQLRQVRHDLPRNFYRELPRLDDGGGALEGYPRIYALALALIKHTGCRLEAQQLERFINAYQREDELATGELWAFPIMLRLALVEDLRRLIGRVTAARLAREKADRVADRVLALAGSARTDLGAVLTREATPALRSEQLAPAFVVQLVARLRDPDSPSGPALEWLNRRLEDDGRNVAEVVRQEHTRQAATQVTVADIITSMRLLSTLDWRTFFRRTSLVQQVLADDPARVFDRMDFPTRDRYNHVIERIAKRTGASETEIARRAVALAATAQQGDRRTDDGIGVGGSAATRQEIEDSPELAGTGPDDVDHRKAHVGYYLIGGGLADLERSFAYSPTLRERIGRAARRRPALTYLGMLALLTALVVALVVIHFLRAATATPSVFHNPLFDFSLISFTLVILLPASDLALGLLNLAITHIFKPRTLPKMDFSDGVPVAARTFVVIPTILAGEKIIEELCERIEVHYLANSDENLFFALLGDLPDAATAETPEDDKLIRLARECIAELNRRYPGIAREGPALPSRFWFFTRGRQWNEGEGKWICPERKRGNLHDFNRLLRGARDTNFTSSQSPNEGGFFASIRSVITLDADTQLPRNSARSLVGAIAHPLNRPRFSSRHGRVTEGYGILQPRLGIALESAQRSPFARVFSTNSGIDPYTTAVSDVYQDLFDEGSYTGKGIYDVDAFEAALANRVPASTLLSHDLFEGLFARAALVTDVELPDDYPASYTTHAKRQHRWTRGDWQIARWLFPRVPDGTGRSSANVLPLAARWKILDNLRRSLVAPALLLFLFSAWTVLPGSPAVWTLFASLVLAFPIYSHLTTCLLGAGSPLFGASDWSGLWRDARTNTGQVALSVAFLPHQAYLMTDAIVRALYRSTVSHRHMLEWVTSAQTERAPEPTRAALLRFMWPAPVLSLLIAVLVGRFHPQALAAAAPFLAAWLAAPWIAFEVSRPSGSRRAAPLSETDRLALRLYARRTWRFFEAFVGTEDHWLPPDNFQEDPHPLVAHRTSPTNIGLLLLSTVAARDFGYTGSLETVERLELTFTTLEKLQKYRGHLFNWYDTVTLEPLQPQYVSTVDSGNLAGHLLAVKGACNEFAAAPLLDRCMLDGMADSLTLMEEEIERLDFFKQHPADHNAKALRAAVTACWELIEHGRLQDEPSTLAGWHTLLRALTRQLVTVDDTTRALVQEYGAEVFGEVQFWIGSVTNLIRACARDIDTLAAWTDALATADELFDGDHFSSDDRTREEWRALIAGLDSIPLVRDIPALCDRSLAQIALLRQRFAGVSGRTSSTDLSPGSEAVPALDVLTARLEGAGAAARSCILRLSDMARLCDRLVLETDFGFLFDEGRKLFRIGHNVRDNQPDNSFYDLLASEARLASFVAIAKGDIEPEHWFHLGRNLVAADGDRALVSWTGTMFEYLMPLLVMRSYDSTLLDSTARAIVQRQIEYGAEHGVAWGVSESAYNARDAQLNYQYAPFGVPGLGLKRGLSRDLVVAPYATMLAAMVEPVAAIANLRRLAREGMLARYGFYESVDYTPDRLPPGQDRAVISTYMAHHQGMSFVALDNLLNGAPMQRRFHAEPRAQATELLLQERVPREVRLARPRVEETEAVHRAMVSVARSLVRTYNAPENAWPALGLLSNGSYTVMVTAAGGGYSARSGMAVTRWREDAVRDPWGSFCYLRDVRSGAVWSTGFQPTLRDARDYEVSFAEDRIEFRRLDAGIRTRTEIIVSTEDDTELRRTTLTNESLRPREIEITSYAEIVLTTPATDAAHPAFSNLSIETEFIPETNALLARRRPRSDKDREVWGVHMMVVEGETIGATQYETDRAHFVGRGRTPRDAAAVVEGRPLSSTVGAVLDPIWSLRTRLLVEPGATALVTFMTAVADSREAAQALADKYNAASVFERAASQAWTRAQVERRHLQADVEDAHLYQRLAGLLIYSHPGLRPSPSVLRLNDKTQSVLWAHGISGDLPILVVRISDARNLPLVRQALHAHEYLLAKRFIFDLVILNDHPPSYAQSLQEALLDLVRTSNRLPSLDKPGGVFLRRSDLMPDADRILLHTVARAVFVTERGTLEEQLQRPMVAPELPPPFVPRWSSRRSPEPSPAGVEPDHLNGLGGFSPDGREYVITLGEGQWTPAPWLNVIANEKEFGFQISESGAGFTWSVNSRENRLTPWTNDAVSDAPGEVLYLHDEDTGALWTPTPLPIREAAPYTVRHGRGYSSFEHTSHGIRQELTAFVPVDAAVKISRLRLGNLTERPRRLSVTSYHELVLGIAREASAPFVITEIDPLTRTVFARNPYNNEFAGRVAFAAMRGAPADEQTVTCDRREFLGANGTTARPAAMSREGLSGRAGAGLDPCAAIRSEIVLGPGETVNLLVLFGEAETREAAQDIVTRFGRADAVEEAFHRVVTSWNELLGTVEVVTPDAALNTMMNGWLLYQTIACRFWSRSAFYQSGGAFGFRDQLQDVMALIYARPDLTREHILCAAGRQFKEGDVQHWWHPPTGRGVRTRFSDDLLWLPYVSAFYIDKTRDAAVLDETTSFLEAPLLKDDEDEAYTQPAVSTERATLYEHCVLAIERSLAVGAHGLPLMGSGDWNDGMNRVGRGGKGESVWLAWFLYRVLMDFAPLCEARGDAERAARYRTHAGQLRGAVEEKAWDGDWYLRAFFDDGTALGSASSDECRIDSIAQSWGVLSGAAGRERALRSVASVDQHLVRRVDGLVMLFTPPFDKSPLDPGYIKGYVPGVRENGGQYTHAAIWMVIAHALLGDGDRAAELFALLNPVNHTATRAGLHRYKVEPYVVAADVYSNPQHIGRGGWTWYTGSSSWMYRAGLESLLGFELRGESLRLNPCIPRSWREYQMTYRRGQTSYKITVENPFGVSRGVVSVELDGEPQALLEIRLVDDGNEHAVRVVLGSLDEKRNVVDAGLPEQETRPILTTK